MSSNHTPTITEPASTDRVVTRVGIDLGVRHLLVAAPESASPSVEGAVVVKGSLVRALYEELGAITRRLQVLDADTVRMEIGVLRWYRKMIIEQFAFAAAELFEYLERFESPVVVLEKLPYAYQPLESCRLGKTDVGSWLLPAFQRRLAGVISRGYPVVYVDPENTTQECHVCGTQGVLVSNGQLRCENLLCPVETVCRDRSAAVSVAQRATEVERGGRSDD